MNSYQYFEAERYHQWLETQDQQELVKLAYRHWRLYTELDRQLRNLYKWADENEIKLPDAGPGFS